MKLTYQLNEISYKDIPSIEVTLDNDDISLWDNDSDAECLKHLLKIDGFLINLYYYNGKPIYSYSENLTPENEYYHRLLIGKKGYGNDIIELYVQGKNNIVCTTNVELVVNIVHEKYRLFRIKGSGLRGRSPFEALQLTSQYAVSLRYTTYCRSTEFKR